MATARASFPRLACAIEALIERQSGRYRIGEKCQQRGCAHTQEAAAHGVLFAGRHRRTPTWDWAWGLPGQSGRGHTASVGAYAIADWFLLNILFWIIRSRASSRKKEHEPLTDRRPVQGVSEA